VSTSLFCQLLKSGRSWSLGIWINSGNNLISPGEFEWCAGHAATHNWKRSIKYLGVPIGDYLQESVTGKSYCWCVFYTTSLPGSVNSSSVFPPSTTIIALEIISYSDSTLIAMSPTSTLISVSSSPWSYLLSFV